MSLSITPYRSKEELTRVHSDVKSFKLVHHAPRGQSSEAQLTALRAKNITGKVYQVGDFFWQEAGTDPYENRALCACFQYVGDNDQCRIHGRKS